MIADGSPDAGLRRVGGSPVFEAHGACLRFGEVRALDNINFTVEAGERVALIGPSGAGKSSLISLFNGTQRPTGGAVRALGTDLARASPREIRRVQHRIGTIHQQYDLVGALRVVHNVNAGHLGRWPLARAAWSLLSPRATGEAAAALERVGIGGKLYARTETLSGGEQQRVAIARVLVQRPAAILADEPIASLDPARGREVLDVLLAAGEAAAATVVICLHDVDAALGRFARVIAIRDGRTMFDGSPSALAPSDVQELFATEAEAR